MLQISNLLYKHKIKFNYKTLYIYLTYKEIKKLLSLNYNL